MKLHTAMTVMDIKQGRSGQPPEIDRGISA
jgi:hypothetical protein